MTDLKDPATWRAHQSQELQALLDLQDKITDMHGGIAGEVRAGVAAGVAEGIRAAVSDPETWTSAIVAMRERAAKETGRWMFSGVLGILKRLGGFVLAGTIIYMVGGWTALASVVKAVFPGAVSGQ